MDNSSFFYGLENDIAVELEENYKKQLFALNSSRNFQSNTATTLTSSSSCPLFKSTSSSTCPLFKSVLPGTPISKYTTLSAKNSQQQSEPQQHS